MKTLRVYFEGDAGLREGFRKFLSGLDRRVMLIAIGSDFKKFDRARRDHKQDECVLLRDSEGPAWKPKGHEFLMVQLMESWFLADPETLAGYFGDGFKRKSLPGQQMVEDIPKEAVEKGLKAATSRSRKGDYFAEKVRHANALLGLVNPVKVRRASPHCDRIFQDLGPPR